MNTLQVAVTPTLHRDALHGLAGEIVRTIEPHTEASAASILIQALAAFGNVVGRRPFFRVEEDRHRLNLYVAIVGDTARARKGTSLGHVRTLFERADAAWVRERLLTGLTTGPGLIWAVRDPVHRVRGGADEIVDDGVADKRVLFQEAELAGIIRRSRRVGGTLLEAWDGRERLATRTRSNGITATGAHVSIIGHVTADELRRSLRPHDVYNGFANRFLFALVARSKRLPDGGQVDVADRERLQGAVADAVAFSQDVGEITRSDAAARMWREVYDAISRDEPGPLGALTARAEAQVVRLSSTYALLDRSIVISPEHLAAAWAVWRFCEESCRLIFAAGDLTVAGRIYSRMAAISPDGMARTDIYKMFGHHVRALEIGSALEDLDREGKIRCERVPGPGRTADVFYARAEAARDAQQAQEGPAPMRDPLRVHSEHLERDASHKDAGVEHHLGSPGDAATDRTQSRPGMP